MIKTNRLVVMPSNILIRRMQPRRRRVGIKMQSRYDAPAAMFMNFRLSTLRESKSTLGYIGYTYVNSGI